MSARQQFMLSLTVGLVFCGAPGVWAAEHPASQTTATGPALTKPDAAVKPAKHATARATKPAKAAKPAKQKWSKRSHPMPKAKPLAAQLKPEAPKAVPTPAASTQTGTQY